MRKTISLILISILSANPVFAFTQIVPLAPPLLRTVSTSEKTSGHLGGGIGMNFATPELHNSITHYTYDGEDVILESCSGSMSDTKDGLESVSGMRK